MQEDIFVKQHPTSRNKHHIRMSGWYGSMKRGKFCFAQHSCGMWARLSTAGSACNIWKFWMLLLDSQPLGNRVQETLDQNPNRHNLKKNKRVNGKKFVIIDSSISKSQSWSWLPCLLSCWRNGGSCSTLIFLNIMEIYSWKQTHLHKSVPACSLKHGENPHRMESDI